MLIWKISLLYRGVHAFYRNSKVCSVQKLSHFEVRKISRISYEIEFSYVYVRIFELLLQLQSNLTEIWNIASIHKRRKIWSINFWFYANFTRKNAGETRKSSFSKIWSRKIGIKSKVDNILQNKCSKFFAFMSKSYVPYFS